MNPSGYPPKPMLGSEISDSFSLDFGPIEVDPTPQRGHRRAHSDITSLFTNDGDDDDEFFSHIENFNLSALDIPQQGLSMVVESSRSDETNGENRFSSTSLRAPIDINGGCGTHHLRNLSVDADFFEGLSFDDVYGGERKVGMHRRTSSMDGSFNLDFEELVIDGIKKAMLPEKLAELALIDPKRAKRILANRQYAARHKERKIRYTSELERKIQMLQLEATTLTMQVTMLRKDTTELNVENKELKLHLQALEQQAQLRNALNEALRQEIQRLRIATGQIA